jgi:hypothetical protein
VILWSRWQNQESYDSYLNISNRSNYSYALKELLGLYFLKEILKEAKKIVEAIEMHNTLTFIY